MWLAISWVGYQALTYTEKAASCWWVRLGHKVAGCRALGVSGIIAFLLVVGARFRGAGCGAKVPELYAC